MAAEIGHAALQGICIHGHAANQKARRFAFPQHSEYERTMWSYCKLQEHRSIVGDKLGEAIESERFYFSALRA